MCSRKIMATNISSLDPPTEVSAIIPKSAESPLSTLTTIIEPSQAPAGPANLSIKDDTGLTCFDRCFGVARIVMGLATREFCDAMGFHVFGTSADNQVYL